MEINHPDVQNVIIIFVISYSINDNKRTPNRNDKLFIKGWLKDDLKKNH